MFKPFRELLIIAVLDLERAISTCAFPEVEIRDSRFHLGFSRNTINSTMTLILFDFDGVLADTLGELLQFGQEACDELGVKHTATQDDLNSLEIMSFATYGRQLEVPENLVDEFVKRCMVKFVQMPNPPKIFDGMTQVIEKLSTRHAIGIITGNAARAVENFLFENGIRQCVSAIFALEQPGTKCEKILRAKGQLAKDTQNVYYVGDALSDIHAAREASVKSIAVSWGHQSVERLIQAEPDYIVRSPQELMEVIEKIG
jgi:phosphoglycolate phosphatase-like HAD superfamily hydrolase